MAAISVTTTPVQVPTGWVVIQNITGSAQPVYYDSVNTVSSTTGVQIPVGGQVSRFMRAEAGVVWLVTAAATADVRVYTDAFTEPAR